MVIIIIEVNGYMKKTLIIVTSLIALLIAVSGSMGAFAQDTWVNLEKNNPINKAFEKDFEQAGNTAEINYVSEKYSEAWKAEMLHAAGLIKKSYKFKEDRQRVDEYVALCTKLASKAFDLAMLNWGDIDQPPGNRNFGTGATGAGMGAQARIYKQAALNLIVHYEGTAGEKKYKFLYKGKGAELDKVRNR
jgi:hypothetical protein